MIFLLFFFFTVASVHWRRLSIQGTCSISDSRRDGLYSMQCGREQDHTVSISLWKPTALKAERSLEVDSSKISDRISRRSMIIIILCFYLWTHSMLFLTLLKSQVSAEKSKNVVFMREEIKKRSPRISWLWFGYVLTVHYGFWLGMTEDDSNNP